MISTALNPLQRVWNSLIALADNQYVFPVAERVEGGVCGPNPTQRQSKADNKWLASTLPAGGSNPVVYLH